MKVSGISMESKFTAAGFADVRHWNGNEQH